MSFKDGRVSTNTLPPQIDPISTAVKSSKTCFLLRGACSLFALCFPRFDLGSEEAELTIPVDRSQLSFLEPIIEGLPSNPKRAIGLDRRHQIFGAVHAAVGSMKELTQVRGMKVIGDGVVIGKHVAKEHATDLFHRVSYLFCCDKPTVGVVSNRQQSLPKTTTA